MNEARLPAKTCFFTTAATNRPTRSDAFSVEVLAALVKGLAHAMKDASFDSLAPLCSATAGSFVKVGWNGWTRAKPSEPKLRSSYSIPNEWHTTLDHSISQIRFTVTVESLSLCHQHHEDHFDSLAVRLLRVRSRRQVRSASRERRSRRPFPKQASSDPFGSELCSL